MARPWRKRKPKTENLGPNIRYAIVDVKFQEVLTANHLVIGEAFNTRDESFTPNNNLIVVAHLGDQIIGEVRRNGILKNNKILLPKTIWSGPLHVYFDPAIVKTS
jgi:hypothetical protein